MGCHNVYEFISNHRQLIRLENRPEKMVNIRFLCCFIMVILCLKIHSFGKTRS